MFLYDWECECGNKFEGMARMSERTHVCELCGSLAKRVISPVRSKLEGWSEHFPTAAMKWTKMHEKEGRKTTQDE